MTDESIFLDYVGDSPRMRVLQYFIEGRDFDYTLTDLLHAGVSWGTLNTLIPTLAELGIILKTRKIGRATLYKINLNNSKICYNNGKKKAPHATGCLNAVLI